MPWLMPVLSVHVLVQSFCACQGRTPLSRGGPLTGGTHSPVLYGVHLEVVWLVGGVTDCTSRVGPSPMAGTRHNAGKARPKWATARRFLQRSCKFIGQIRPPLAPLPPTIQQIPEAAGFSCRAQTFWFFLSPTLQPRQAHRQALGTAGTREPMGSEENRSQHAIAYHKHKHALPYFQVPTHHMAHTHMIW